MVTGGSGFPIEVRGAAYTRHDAESQVSMLLAEAEGYDESVRELTKVKEEAEAQMVALAHGCDYLFQVKANQPDMLDALETCFFQETPVRPADEITEKRGSIKKRGGFGSTSTTPSISESI